MISKTSTQKNESDGASKKGSGAKGGLTEVLKRAREYAYLGMYEDAAKMYKDSLTEIETRKSNKKTGTLSQAYAELLREVRKEADLIDYLLYMVQNAKLPSNPGTVKSERKLPFNAKPFAFHQGQAGPKPPDNLAQYHSNNSDQFLGYPPNQNYAPGNPYNFNRHNSLNKPPKEYSGKSYDPTSNAYAPTHQGHSNKFQEENPPSSLPGHGNYNHPYGNPMGNAPAQNPFWNPNSNQNIQPPGNFYGMHSPHQGFDYNDPGNYRAFPEHPQAPPKDPMVWDPPSPKPVKQNRRPAPPQNQKNSQPPGANNNYLDKNKRDYDKPWLKKPANNQQGANKRSNSANKNPNFNVVINGVEKQKYLYSIYPEGNGPDSDLINMIENNLITTHPNVTFEDIAGLQDAKEALIMYVVCSLNMKNFFKDIRSPPKGILLFGPPGTGKTMLAKAIATTGKTTFINVNPATLASKWKGDSEKLVRILFDMARYYAPTTIFIDEIDSLLSERSSTEHESSRKVKTQFFTEIDGLTTNIAEDKEKEVPKVFLLAATNRPWDLDDAIMRRLTKRIYIPLPDSESRRKLFDIKLKSINLSKDIDYDYLVKHTERYNSDDIESVCREAAMAPFKRRMNVLANQQSTQMLRDVENEIINEEITMDDFKKALQNVKSSASDKYSAQYDEWKTSHGST